MTLFEVEELMRYWTANPPSHLALAAWTGNHRSWFARDASAQAQTGVEVAGLLTRLGPGFKSGDVHDGLPKVLLDFESLRRNTAAIDLTGARRAGIRSSQAQPGS